MAARATPSLSVSEIEVSLSPRLKAALKSCAMGPICSVAVSSSLKFQVLIGISAKLAKTALPSTAEKFSLALTSEETANIVYGMAKKLGKEPILCRDTYLFVANRAAGSAGNLNEAVELLWAHIATPEDIDKAVRLGFNRPMGPLEAGDLVGAWGALGHSEAERVRELGWERGHVHPLIKMMYRAGYTGGLGKKGIYDFWEDCLSKW